MEFLRNTKLEKQRKFWDNGYDDMDFIESVTKVQLIDMLRAVGIYEKPDHRVKFFVTFSILKSKEKQFN